MMKARFRTNGRALAGSIASVIFLALIAWFGFRADDVLRGFVASFSSSSADGATYASLTREALVARLSDAERELARTRYQDVLIELLSEENAELRKAAHAVAARPAATARVLVRPPRTHYDTLVIDLGADAGLAEGDLVGVPGVALGEIESVSARSALVKLFSNPGDERDVILGTPAAVAIARGLGGGSFELALPREVEISVGDLVRLPDTESLALGIVVEVFSEPTDVSKTVRIASLVSFAELDFVEVVPRAQ